jgi:hypothetical protein
MVLVRHSLPTPTGSLDGRRLARTGRQLRVRHDDPRLGPYTPVGARVRSAVELASDVEGLRLVLASVLGERYRVRVSDDGSVMGLWRR